MYYLRVLNPLGAWGFSRHKTRDAAISEGFKMIKKYYCLYFEVRKNHKVIYKIKRYGWNGSL